VQLTSALQIKEILLKFKLKNPILFIDEVQRLENPGLFLKTIIDLKLPIKLLVSGSSQLEIKSKIQEFMTGRDFESIILPLSQSEIPKDIPLNEILLYGSYPRVLLTDKKTEVLSQLYKTYITKDIIEILQIGKPLVIEKLLTLIAHASGQLVNYQQLATDCRVTAPTVQSYLEILEETYILSKVTPFVGNKRTEITSNPVYYFIDNGFRNEAIRNFNSLTFRGDIGLLVQSYIFQEILKFKTQHFMDFKIHFWRTKTKAEVDFVLFKNDLNIIPIEVKYTNMKRATISRGFRSFLQAYQPPLALIVTKSFNATIEAEGITIHFISVNQLGLMFELINNILNIKFSIR
jgi:predicted AAA+ superfamily ATPase